MLAATAGNLAVVEALLAAGADVEIRDKEGETALTLAADSGNTDVVQTLLGAGADANVKNGDGGTALMPLLLAEMRRSPISYSMLARISTLRIKMMKLL